MENFFFKFRFFHSYLEKYVVLILSGKKKMVYHILIIHVILCHIGYSVSFHSMTNFTIDFLRISFFLFHTFFQTSWYRQFLSNLLHGMMRAFCCIYFIISVPCVRIHHLEREIAIFLLFHIICFNIIFLLNPSIIPCSTM